MCVCLSVYVYYICTYMYIKSRSICGQQLFRSLKADRCSSDQMKISLSLSLSLFLSLSFSLSLSLYIYI